MSFPFLLSFYFWFISLVDIDAEANIWILVEVMGLISELLLLNIG